MREGVGGERRVSGNKDKKREKSDVWCGSVVVVVVLLSSFFFLL
jgi:hypothetical protein